VFVDPLGAVFVEVEQPEVGREGGERGAADRQEELVVAERDRHRTVEN
jgi:hypothetical protein